MKKYLLFATVIVLSAAALLIFLYLDSEGYADEGHFTREETEVIFTVPSGAAIRLYKAGNALREATEISFPEKGSAWLSTGNYFASVTIENSDYLFPIPLTGYRCGPDKDGSFLVNARTPLPERPSVLIKELPPFVFIPSGSFLFGSRQLPTIPHYVWLTSFYTAPCEVTNEEFRGFLMDADGYTSDLWWTESGKQWKKNNPSQNSAALHPKDEDYQRFGHPLQPVTRVNWFEANAFCKWLTAKIGGGQWLYTMPNEAEWEKAARGPDNLEYRLSMTISDAQLKLFNWKKNPEDPHPLFDVPSTAERFSPNRYGLFHTTGNVSEWTMSVDRPFNRKDPFQMDSRNHEATEGMRVIRGGSWYSASIANMTVSYRDAFLPQHSTRETGFRIIAKRLP